nr:hypothetical protein [Tanacetum cinerariifolium]
MRPNEKFHQDQEETIVGIFLTDTGRIMATAFLALYCHQSSNSSAIENEECATELQGLIKSIIRLRSAGEGKTSLISAMLAGFPYLETSSAMIRGMLHVNMRLLGLFQLIRVVGFGEAAMCMVS